MGILRYEESIKEKLSCVFLREVASGQLLTFEKIARKNKWRFYHIRLSLCDWPDIEYGHWHIQITDSNQPILIVFDELDRALPSVRERILKILEKRQVKNIQFDKNVFLVALGSAAEKNIYNLKRESTMSKDILFPKVTVEGVTYVPEKLRPAVKVDGMEYCIIETHRERYAGYVETVNGKQATLRKVCELYSYKSLPELATIGPIRTSCEVDKLIFTDVDIIVSCSEKAKQAIQICIKNSANKSFMNQ